MTPGEQEMVTLRQIWQRWLKSDCDWAAKIIVEQGGVKEEDEFDFLLEDWREKFETWLYPYVERLWKTEHITPEEACEFAGWASWMMGLALTALHTLEVTTDG
jgi:hypothetical protein